MLTLCAVSRFRQISEEPPELAPAVPTQAHVVAWVGVSVNAGRACELDRSPPRKATAKRLAHVLGVQVDQVGLDDAATDTTHDGHIVKELA